MSEFSPHSPNNYDLHFSPPFVSAASGGRHTCEVDLVISVVTSVFRIDAARLFAKRRGKAPVALARQVAMYVVHICCGKSFTEVGEIFGRDRTTVSYACQIVEDKREDPDVDWLLDLIECSVAKFVRYAEEAGR